MTTHMKKYDCAFEKKIEGFFYTIFLFEKLYLRTSIKKRNKIDCNNLFIFLWLLYSTSDLQDKLIRLINFGAFFTRHKLMIDQWSVINQYFLNNYLIEKKSINFTRDHIGLWSTFINWLIHCDHKLIFSLTLMMKLKRT